MPRGDCWRKANSIRVSAFCRSIIGIAATLFARAPTEGALPTDFRRSLQDVTACIDADPQGFFHVQTDSYRR
jgi:hypothetical protein